MTDFSRKRVPQSKGRPSGLSDPQLHNRRHQLVQIFESTWGEIGWELHNCTEPEKLIRIFAAIATPGTWIPEILTVFYRASSESGSGATLRRLRAERRALGEPIRAAGEANRRAEEELRKVNWALDRSPESKQQIEQIQTTRSQEAQRAAQEHQRLLDEEFGLETRIRALESVFSRQELFQFLKSGRYELTPLNLANAAAGLPHMGWRRSMRRCIKAPCNIANGSAYQIFKAIRYLITTADNETENALVTTFQKGIPSLPPRYQLAKAELAENWFYLEYAIRQVKRTKSHAKALPFEITKRYLKRFQSASEVDLILAEQVKLKPFKVKRAVKPAPVNP